jgi:excisionase family DNA binding protein
MEGPPTHAFWTRHFDNTTGCEIRSTMNDIRLIDIAELSRRLSVPKGTLYNWVYLRRIPFIKAGRSLRFNAEEVIQSLPHCPIMDQAGQRWKGR